MGDFEVASLHWGIFNLVLGISGRWFFFFLKLSVYLFLPFCCSVKGLCDSLLRYTNEIE